jgi:hypothetical protein
MEVNMVAASLAPVTRRNYLLNLLLLVLFVAVQVTGEAGVYAWHRWLSVSLAAGLLLHLAWHWASLRRLPALVARRAAPGRAGAVVDLLLVLVLAVTVATGLIVSTWLSAAPDEHWIHQHHFLPKLMLVFVAVHLIQHRAWIARTTPRFFQGVPRQRERT